MYGAGSCRQRYEGGQFKDVERGKQIGGDIA